MDKTFLSFRLWIAYKCGECVHGDSECDWEDAGGNVKIKAYFCSRRWGFRQREKGTFVCKYHAKTRGEAMAKRLMGI